MASQLRYDAQGRPYYSDRDWGEGFSLDTPAGQLVKPVPKPRQARSPVPRPFPRQWTPEDPATQEEIDRAFYSPVPGAPPPPPRPFRVGGRPLTEAGEYILGPTGNEFLNRMRAAQGQSPAQLWVPSPQSIETINAVQDYSANGRPAYGDARRYQGTPIANPLQDRLRGDMTGLSPEEQAAGRLIQSTQGHNPPRLVMPVPAPGPGEAGFGEGYYQGQSGVTVPGVGRRASNQVLGAGPVGAGYQSTGMTTGGVYGSPLMMGQLPAPVAPAARRAPAGGYLDFNEWLAAREAKPEDTGTAQPRFPDKKLGMSGTPMGGMVSASMIPSMAMGGWPANMTKPPVPTPPPAAAQPVAPSATGSWTNPVQPRFPPGRGGGPVYDPATATAGQAAAGTVAPAAAQAAAQAAGGPAPSPGFFRRNWPVGAGVGTGAVVTAMLGGMGGSPGVTAPVGMHPSQAGDPSLQPAQVPSSPYWAARQRAVRSRYGTPTPESIADARARNDMIGRRPTLPYADRAALVAERGIAAAQARDMRLGKASPELESSYYLARSPEENAKIMAERARTEGYVGAAREEAAGAIGAAEATASAFRDAENSKALLAIMVDPAATPEMKAWAQDRLQGLIGSGEQQVIEPVVPAPATVSPWGGMSRSDDPEEVRLAMQYREAARRLEEAERRANSIRRWGTVSDVMTLGIPRATQAVQNWLGGR